MAGHRLSIVRPVSAPSRRLAWLGPLGVRGCGLDRACVEPIWHLSMAREVHGSEEPMIEPPTIPSIVVTIGRQTRLYHAFITSAPCRLDAPATVTLYASTLADVAVFGANEIALDAGRARSCARLVLVDATELAWQRARCREERHLLAPADAGLVGSSTLQQWLWQRLRGFQHERAGRG
jgi:hypothetical protein